MTNVSSRRLPAPRRSTFDVTNWLAGLGRCSSADVHYQGETERDGQLTVSYDCAGMRAQVQVARAGGMNAAAWELTAEVGDSAGRVVVPGDTRFIWRRSAS